MTLVKLTILRTYDVKIVKMPTFENNHYFIVRIECIIS